MTKAYLRSFAGGEIAPELYGRLDLAKNITGLGRCLNFIVLPHGPISNRAGWEYVNETKDSSKKSTLLPFIYSTEQAYVLEVGDQYIRIHTEGASVLSASQAITAISKANPGVLTYVGADTFTAGDVVFIAGGEMVELRNRFVKVGTVNAGANTFTLLDLAGNNLNTTGFTTYTAGGTVSEIYEVSTPYLEAHLFDLHWAQSADIMTLVHTSYQQRQLSRVAAANWTLATLAFTPTTATPAQPTVVASPASGTDRTRYKIVNVSDDILEESLSSAPAVVGTPTAITAITLANPGVITAVAHGRVVDDAVYISGIVGTTQLNAREFLVSTVPSVDTLTLKTLDGTVVDTSAYTAWANGGTVAMIDVVNSLSTAGNKNTITLPVLTAGVTRRNIYKYRNGIYAYIGQSAEGTFVDDNITPDLTQSLPEGDDPFVGAGNYPGAVGYYGGRRWFAGTLNQQQNAWATRSGTESNLTYSIPTRDDDRIAVRLTSQQANRIRHIVPLDSLVLLSSGGVSRIGTVTTDAITPSSILPKTNSRVGVSNVQPVVAGDDAVLYAQAHGGRIRELKPSETDVNGAYKSIDISILAPHLFDGFTIVSMCYTHAPFKTAWFVRSDGLLLGLTYVPEHQVGALHQHNTDGAYESVCSVPEGNEDMLYAVVRRTINGRTVRNIERMHSRQLTRLQDAFFVDAGLSFNNTIAATLTPGAGALTVGTEDVIFTAGSAVFAATDVDRYIHYDYTELNDEGQTLYKKAQAVITGYTDTTHVTATIEAAWPSLTAIASAGWRMTLTEITGAWHLIGETVSVLADGAVYPQAVVSALGKITLDPPASKGCIGLPYNSDAKTMPLALETAAFSQGMKKNVNKVALRVNESSGVFVGPSFAKLREAKQRTDELYGTPPDRKTGIMNVMTTPSWADDGQLCIRQPNPLPLTVVALVPDVSHGS